MIVFIDWQIVMSWFWLACGGGGGGGVGVRDHLDLHTRARCWLLCARSLGGYCSLTVSGTC
jgi:hypothetical protein